MSKPALFTRAALLQNLRNFWPDAVVMGALWIAATQVDDGRVVGRFFVERDPALSFPMAEGSQVEVPNWAIFFIGLACCIILVWLTQLLVYFIPGTTIRFRNQRQAALVTDMTYSLLVFAEVLSLTYFLDNALKIWGGKPRPCFFAQCNYKGYADALATGDFTAYIANTIPGKPGSLADCLVTDPAILKDAHMSWPSTHSAWGFAGLGFLSIFLFWTLASVRVRTQSQMWKLFAAFPPLIAAGLIATTRARDYFHDFGDIVAGSILGFSIALFLFWLHYPTPPAIREEDTEDEITLTNPSKLVELPVRNPYSATL